MNARYTFSGLAASTRCKRTVLGIVISPYAWLIDSSILGRSRSGARYRENGHDLDGFPGKDRKMRMPLEEFGRSLMRVRANDQVGTHLIACIFDAALRDFFGLAERSAHANDCGLMFFGPRLPSGSPLFLLRESLLFWHGIPCCHSRVRLATDAQHDEWPVCTVGSSFRLLFAGS